MVLPTATKPIFSKLQTKLGLQQTDNPKLYLSDAIVSVVDVDFVLSKTMGVSISSSVASRADVYTVPSGKFWKLKVVAMNTGNARGFNVICNIDVGGQIDIAALPVTSTLVCQQMNDIKLKSGDTITLNAQPGVSGTIIMSMLYEEFDA